MIQILNRYILYGIFFLWECFWCLCGKYEECVYVNNTFAKIGDTTIDLSQYSITSEMNTAINTALADYTTTANLIALLSGKVAISAELIEE